MCPGLCGIALQGREGGKGRGGRLLRYWSVTQSVTVGHIVPFERGINGLCIGILYTAFVNLQCVRSFLVGPHPSNIGGGKTCP